MKIRMPITKYSHHKSTTTTKDTLVRLWEHPEEVYLTSICMDMQCNNHLHLIIKDWVTIDICNHQLRLICKTMHWRHHLDMGSLTYRLLHHKVTISSSSILSQVLWVWALHPQRRLLLDRLVL